VHTKTGRYSAVIPPTFLALVLLSCGTAAGEQWMLVTDDGPVEADGITPSKDGASLLVAPSGKKVTVALDRCIGLMCRTTARPKLGRDRDARVGIELHSGDIIRATDLAFKEKTVTARHPAWKDLSFPAGAVKRIRISPAPNLPIISPSFSGVRFVNGDEVAGRVVSIVGETILVEVEGVGKLPVEGLDSVADVVLSPAGKEPKKKSAGENGTVTLLCRSGDMVAGRLLGGGWTVQVSWRKDAVTVAPGQVKSVAFHGDGHVFLSGMKAPGAQQTPWIDSMKPWRADASLDGGPLTMGGYRALKGLAMNSRTALKFSVAALSDVPLRFVCLLGVDPASFPGSGDADFVAAADGKTLVKTRVISGASPQPLSADIPAGTKTLTITLDYGRRGSLGDFVNAMWAALVKLPAPPPPADE